MVFRGIIMDKYIELMLFYWADWQQTAILNTRYSVVLAVSSFLIGGLILKRGKVAKLKQQLTQDKKLLAQAESKCEELLNQQKNDGEKIDNIQHQLTQASNSLQYEKDLHQSVISSKEQLFIKSINEKEQEIGVLNATITDKTQLSEQLQNELDSQKSNTTQFTELQEKVVEMEKEASQSTIELNTLKQQLETEINNKNDLTEQLEKHEDLAKNHIEIASALDLELEKMNSAVKTEEVQPQEAEPEETKHEPQIPQVELEAQETEIKVEPVKPDVAIPSDKSEESPSVINDLSSSFSSPAFNEPAENNLKSEEVAPIDQQNIDPLINSTPVTPDPVESKVFAERAPVTKARPAPVVEAIEEDDMSFSGKLAEVADKMDSFQGRIKGFFKKK